MTLADKIAVVTGGTKGIGLAIAEILVKNGAKVFVCGRDKKDLRIALDDNAGMGIFGKTVEEISGDQFRQVIETNLLGVYYACHYAVPMIKRRGGGYIINISSLAGQNAHPKMAAYNASKFGLNGFSESLMQEVRQDNIKVSYICPGSVNTYFGGDMPNENNAWQLQPADIAQTVLNLLEMDPRALPSKVEIRPSKPPAK
jgi:3-oxoacyl-[acyl-carrier protein] reductase